MWATSAPDAAALRSTLAVVDVRMAVRRLVQARGFSVLAIVTLVIGITAVSAVFSLASRYG